MSNKQILTALINRHISVSRKDQEPVNMIVRGFTEKTGKLRSGEELPYMMVGNDDMSVTMTFHPRVMVAVATKPEGDSGVMLIEVDTVATTKVEALIVDEVKKEVNEVAEDLTNVTTAPLTPPVEAKTSKKSLCEQIYRNGIANGEARKDIIAKFISEAGATVAGAGTYYTNFKSGPWKV